MTVLQSPEAMIVICTVILIAYTAHVLDKAFASSEQFKAGYRDGSINYELEHCPACKNIADRQEALAENDRLRELATYALKHIIEFECEVPDREMLRGKPCEDCADYGSSDCPKCMPRMFDVSGIEVDE